MVDGSKAGRLVPWVVVSHLLGAVLVTILVVSVATLLLRHFGEGFFHQLGGALIVLLVVQLSFGMSSLWIRMQAVDRVQPMPVDAAITTAHLATGALILAISVVLTLCLKSDSVSRHMATPNARSLATESQ